MKRISPGETLKLWVIYQENTIAVTGLIDLTVEVLNASGGTLLTGTSLTELGAPGEYSYLWNTSGIPQDTYAFAYFKKAGVVIDVEEYLFTTIEDMDGVAF